MFNKFLGFFKKKEEQVEDKAKDLMESAEDLKDELLDSGKEKVEDAVGIAREVGKDIETKKEEFISDLEDRKEEIKNVFEEKTEEVKDNFEEKTLELKKSLAEKRQGLKKDLDKLDDKLEEVKEDLKAKEEEIEENPSLSEILEEKKDEFLEKHSVEETILKDEQISEENSSKQVIEDSEIDEVKVGVEEVKVGVEEVKVGIQEEDFSGNLNGEEKKPKKLGFLERLKTGLLKTRDAVSSSIDNLLNGKATIDDDLYEDLEEIMISADMGVETTMNMIDKLRDVIAEKHIRDPRLIKSELSEIMKEELRGRNINNQLNIVQGKQAIVLVIGVNGVGKTTTIGKLAHNIQKEGKSVILAAADTFRAAAIDQLTEWANRAGVDIISHNEGADPASVVFDAIAAQKARNKDVLIIDTAGRLHNKKNLMNELEKINRIIDKQHPEASRETLLVLDATTGQNAIFQAKEFNNVTDISGIVLTKLDGTAKGGVVFPLQVEHQIPVKYIGIGEGIDNLEKFDSDKFVEALF